MRADATGVSWPPDAEALAAEQRRLAAVQEEPAALPEAPRLGGCFATWPRGVPGPGAAGDLGWAGAALLHRGRIAARAVVEGHAGAPYQAGLLALREGPLLESAVRALPELPDVLLVDATGRDHPRGAGLARQLGAVLGVPTVGITHRPLVAEGAWPPDEPGASAPLTLGGVVVGHWLRTRRGTRPLCVHAGWRIDPDAAVDVVRGALAGARTPLPLREARRLARLARSA
jgi:deoxyribonuclease V